MNTLNELTLDEQNLSTSSPVPLPKSDNQGLGWNRVPFRQAPLPHRDQDAGSWGVHLDDRLLCRSARDRIQVDSAELKLLESIGRDSALALVNGSCWC